MTDRRDSTSHGSRWKPVWLVALLVTSFKGYWWLVRFDAVSGWEAVVDFLICMGMLFLLCWGAYWIWRGNSHSRPIRHLVLIGALIFRILLIPAGLSPQLEPRGWTDAMAVDLNGKEVAYEPFLLFDTDIWRYLWDAHLTYNLGTPYGVTPASDTARALAMQESGAPAAYREIHDRVQFPSISTVYPPGAQWLFLLSYWVAPGSIVVWKLLLIGLDMAVILSLEKLLIAVGASPALLVLYAWNPLVVKVFAGSAHYDVALVLAVTLLLFAVVKGRALLGGVLLGLGIAIKLTPIVLIPFLFRRLGWRGLTLSALVLLVLAAPFAWASGGDPSGLLAFGQSWEFNAGAYSLIRTILQSFGLQAAPAVARVLMLAALASIIVWLSRRDAGTALSFPRIALVAMGATLLLSPVVNPWYVTWLLPLALAARRPEWIALSALVLLAFLVMVDGTQRWWALAIQHAGFLALLAVVHFRRQLSPTFPERNTLT